MSLMSVELRKNTVSLAIYFEKNIGHCQMKDEHKPDGENNLLRGYLNGFRNGPGVKLFIDMVASL